MRWSYVVWALVLGCGAPGRPIVSSPDAPAPVPAPVKVKAPSQWTQPPVGWIAFRALRKSPRGPKDGEPYWLPTHASADVVFFGEFSKVAKDTSGAFRAVGGAGPLTLRLQGSSEERYGCEENTQQMSAFAAEGPVGPRLVWILPTTSQLSPKPVPVVEEQLTSDHGRWTVGHYQIAIDKLTKLKGELRIARDGQVIKRDELETYAMDGADDPHFDLVEFRFGIPIPIAAYAVDDDRILLIAHYQGFEGNTFEVIAVDPIKAQVATEMRQNLYYCAF